MIFSNKLVYNDINVYDLNIQADEIYHLDYKEIFKMYDSPNVVYYLDPPYYKKEFLYAGCENYTKDFHIELHDEIKKLKSKVILSYEYNKFIVNLYNDLNIHEYKGNNVIFIKELVITNF